MPVPGTPEKPYLVQFTDTEGGYWKESLFDFSTLREAHEHAEYLVKVCGVPSARVLHVQAYLAERQFRDRQAS